MFIRKAPIHPLRLLAAVFALTLASLTTACRLQVDRGANGQEKDVKIDTPLGGLRVNTDSTVAADIGLPVYPGARAAADHEGNKSADVHIGFGDWQLRVKGVQYQTQDSQDKVVAFYKKALGRYGDVIECEGQKAVGSPIITREGLTCANSPRQNFQTDSSNDFTYVSLKAGSVRHQHIFGIERPGSGESGIKFALVELDLPQGVVFNGEHPD